MRLFGADNKEMMSVSALQRDGNTLVIKGKIFGTMPMTAKVKPSELRKALKLVDFKLILFLLTLLFRKDDV
jgi:hypothetical protein